MSTASLIVDVVASVPDVPDIAPDFNAPWMAPLLTIVSYVLGTGLVLGVLALIAAIICVTGRSWVSERVRDIAAGSIGWVGLGIILLASVSGLWQWLVGFQFTW